MVSPAGAIASDIYFLRLDSSSARRTYQYTIFIVAIKRNVSAFSIRTRHLRPSEGYIRSSGGHIPVRRWKLARRSYEAIVGTSILTLKPMRRKLRSVRRIVDILNRCVGAVKRQWTETKQAGGFVGVVVDSVFLHRRRELPARPIRFSLTGGVCGVCTPRCFCYLSRFPLATAPIVLRIPQFSCFLLPEQTTWRMFGRIGGNALRCAVRRPAARRNLLCERRFSAHSSHASAHSTVPSAASPLGSITTELDRISPCFEISAEKIEILDSPASFYSTLKV